MSRSLKVGTEYLDTVKFALLRNSFPSQRSLALDMGLALSTVSRFFTGKPVDYSIFVDICHILGLGWRDIADLSHAKSRLVRTKSSNSRLKLAPEVKQLAPSTMVMSRTKSRAKTNNQTTTKIEKIIPFPEGVVPPDSPFYQTRDNIESICYETVVNSAALIQIKAPKLMGKSSLMMKTLAYAQSQNYSTVYLDLANLEKSIMSDLDKFLRWLCLMVGKKLTLENQLNDYWDTEILGSNGNCTAYFEEYLLPAINAPLVLAIDTVDRIFPYTNVIEDFLGMLRSWHEKGKISTTWQNLRLMMAYSTGVDIPLDLNQSTFNGGVPIELKELSFQQIEELASLHRLDWMDQEIVKLMNIVGGQPYLVRLAMYHLSYDHSLPHHSTGGNSKVDRFNLEILLANASKESGIFSHYLRRHLEILQQKPSLAVSLKQVVTSNHPIELDSMHTFQLYSMGLVQLQDNQVIPRYKLYRDYFSRVLT